MKRFCVDLILVVALLLLIIMPFPFVQGADPIVVQNDIVIEPPYETGNMGSYENPRNRANADASYNKDAGIVYTYCYASQNSIAWAEANLTDAFEIIHSSQYDITFNFAYKGFIEIANLSPGNDSASAKIIFKVSLVDRNGGITVGTKNEEILFTEEFNDTITDSKTMMFNGLQLQGNHVYDWTAGIRTETETNYVINQSLRATVDFYNIDQGYQVDITQVLVEDVYPDNTPPITTSSISGTTGENDWYISSVSMTLIPVDNGYGVDYTNYRINGGAWNIYTSTFNVIPDGTNVVDFYSVDKANNEEIPHKTRSIKIDKTAPTASVLINGGSDYTSAALVPLSLTYTDVSSGVSKVRYSNDGISYTQWENPVATKYWTLTSGDGTKIVYYQTKDNAGNISPTATDEIILDTTPPSATISINEGDEYTNSTSVTLYLQTLEDQSSLQVRYRNYGGSFTDWESFSETKQWTLLLGDGIKTVDAQFMDEADVKSNIFSDTIVLDTVPPTGSIEINNGNSNTTSISVTVTPNASDANGVAQMRLRNDVEEWSNWEEVATKQWNLTSGLGSKTVFVQFKDNTGWISQSYNATIDLVEPPPSPTPTPAPTPTPSPTPPARGNVIVYVRDGNNNPISGATVTSIAQPTGQSSLSAITDSQGAVTFNNIIAGTYSFQASKGIFGSDNVQANVKSQQTISINITLMEDEIKPSISVTLNPEGSGSPQRAFTVTAEDNIEGSGIKTITLYIDDVPVVTWTAAGVHTYDEGVYWIGVHIYYVEAVDNAGNEARYPSSGYLEFTVVDSAYVGQIEMWKIMGVVLVLVMGTALFIFSMKTKK